MARPAAAFGRIERWEDARGFGFVLPETATPDGPDRLFLHIGDVDAGSARPTAGDRVRFTPRRDDDARWQATRVAVIPEPPGTARPRAAATRPPRTPSPRDRGAPSKAGTRPNAAWAGGPAARRGRARASARSPTGGRGSSGPGRGLLVLGLLTSVWLGTLAAALSAQRLPAAAPAVLAALNALTFVAFALDKHAARTDRRRTPERHLHLLELLGGWPASGLAQQVLRHKRAKPAYRRVYAAMIALHLLALALWTFA